MPLALCCMSHSPLLELTSPPPEDKAQVIDALARARDFVADFDPEIVVLFVPDHFNGFFYRLMPPFCIGMSARTVGDYGTLAGTLDVPYDIAEQCAEAVLAGGVDVSVSHDMVLDHATAQPLGILLGGLDARPVVPVFVNSAATPLAPIARARRLGEGVGRFLAGRSERVLVAGSGGLSHDPPVPALGTAPPLVAERLVSGRELTGAEEQQKVTGAIAAGMALAAGSSGRIDLAPEWDRAFLDTLAGGHLDALDHWSNAEIARHGCGAQEIRTWVAAYAALAAAGRYEVTYRFYRPVPEYIAGFAVTTAIPARAAE